MLVIDTRVNPTDETFVANRERMQLLVNQLRDRVTGEKFRQLARAGIVELPPALKRQLACPP